MFAHVRSAGCGTLTGSLSPSQARAVRHPRGSVVILMAVLIIVLIGFVSLAVDYGRVQIVKSELQGIADAAARAAALELAGGNSAARDAAQEIALENHANGAPLVISDADVQVGLWQNGAFTAGGSSPNAVRVIASCSEANNNPVPLIFASALGWNSVNVSAKATAVVVGEVNVNATISAQANPWLAGMPNGTIANPNNPAKNNKGFIQDKAPYQSPKQITGLPLVPGQSLTFDSISGDARHDPNLADYQPDGQLNAIYTNWGGSEHGKSDIRSPINAIIGVFLSDDSPTSSSAPSMLDFSSESSRDETTYSPQLKQTFFIGDGLTSDGVTQQFVVPEGATRLYIGMMDGWEWSNNSGSRTIRVNRPPQISLVE